MKKVYVCAPFSSDRAENVEKATQYSKYVFSFGLTPIAPQIYSNALNLSRLSELRLGKEAGRSKLWSADELWVFGDCVTSEMREEIRIFQAINGLNAKIRYVSDAQLRRFLRRRKGRHRR